MTTSKLNTWQFEREYTAGNSLENTGDRYIASFSSPTGDSEYIKYLHPFPVAASSKITVRGQVRYSSGIRAKIAIEGNTEPDFSGVAAIYSNHEVSADGDWHEIQITEISRFDYPYFRVILGKFSSVELGDCVVEFRDLEVEVDAPSDSSHMSPNRSAVKSKCFGGKGLSKVSGLDATGASSISYSSGRITGSSPDNSSYAILNVGDSLGGFGIECSGKDYVTARVRASSVSGYVTARINYQMSSGSFNERSYVLPTGSGELVEITLPIPENATRISMVLGCNTTSIGAFVIDSLSLDFFGESSSDVSNGNGSMCCVVRGTSGSYAIDDEFSRYSNVGFESVTSDSDSIYVQMSTPKTRPVLIVQGLFFGSGTTYFPRMTSNSQSELRIQMFDFNDPTTVVDPSTILGSVFIQIIGVSSL